MHLLLEPDQATEWEMDAELDCLGVGTITLWDQVGVDEKEMLQADAVGSSRLLARLAEASKEIAPKALRERIAVAIHAA